MLHIWSSKFLKVLNTFPSVIYSVQIIINSLYVIIIPPLAASWFVRLIPTN